MADPEERAKRARRRSDKRRKNERDNLIRIKRDPKDKVKDTKYDEEQE